MTLTRRQLLVTGGAAAAAIAVSRRAAPPAHAAAGGAPVYLAGNENAHGPSAGARRAIVEHAGEANRYARAADVDALRAAIAARHRLPPDHVLVAPGSQAVLDLASLAFTRDGGGVIAGDPSYPGFVRQAAKLGDVALVPLAAGMVHDLEAMERRVTASTRVVYVCNPNNPTGTMIPGARLRAFCAAVSPRAAVLVDEAYAEYVEDPAYASMVDLVRDGANVLVSRSFSKIFGLAGMRIGYALGKPELLGRLAGFRSVGDWWIGSLAVHAARASLDDDVFVATTRRLTAAARADTIAALRAAGFSPTDARASFVWFRAPGRAEALGEALEARGVIVNARANPHDGVRVTVGTRAEMRVFARALRASVAAL